MENNVYYQSASQIVSNIKNKEVSVEEVVKEHLKRIKNTNGKINAIVSLKEESEVIAEARAADVYLSKNNREIGPLFGLPIAIKDTHNASGFVTTKGFQLFKNQVAKTDDITTKRIKEAGAIILGKTNVPEFAAGSHTFNTVFGTTKNPYNRNKTAGGSSGGAAAALASGMIPIADGSDMGGSCRNPAAYNNVVGLRPSPGKIPIENKPSMYGSLGVKGPLARNVSDLARIFTVLSGFNYKNPLSSISPFNMSKNEWKEDVKGIKIGYSLDLNKQFPVSPIVKTMFEKQLSILSDIGCELENEAPKFDNAREVFQILRANEFASNYKDIYKSHRNIMKETVIWNIEKGLKLTGKDLREAERSRTEIYASLESFFKKYDFLVMPVSQVQPFDITKEYPTIINNCKMSNYIEWMESCSHISITGCPAISIPAGFCDNGLPFGLQIVAPNNEDSRLLKIAYAFEQATKYSERHPVLT